MDSLPRKCLEKKASIAKLMKSFFTKLLRLFSNPLILGFLIAGFFIVGGFTYWAYRAGYSINDLHSLIDQTINYISNYPVLAFLAVMIAGGLPIPLSPVLILAAVLFTNRYGLPAALLFCYSAMVLNMIWTYFLSAYPMRHLFERIIQLFAKKLPEIPEHHKAKVALIIRITPGIPFFLQNYFLGVSRVPFGKYLIISLSIQAFYTTAFVVGGGAIFEGKAGLAIAAVSLFVVFGIIVSWIRSRNKTIVEETPSL